MQFSLFYNVQGHIQVRPEVEERAEAYGIEAKEILAKLLRLARKPYKYEIRVDGENGESWYIRRNNNDVKDGTYWVEYKPRWNASDGAKHIRYDQIMAEIVPF